MKLDRERFRLALETGEVLRLDSPRGVEVECESGRLWITEEARGRDIWLNGGERLRLDSRGLALLEAHGPTKVRIAEA